MGGASRQAGTREGQAGRNGRLPRCYSPVAECRVKGYGERVVGWGEFATPGEARHPISLRSLAGIRSYQATRAVPENMSICIDEPMSRRAYVLGESLNGF